MITQRLSPDYFVAQTIDCELIENKKYKGAFKWTKSK
jgi:hypothetical protein